MAIVNVTDDSFYAQSRTMSEKAVAERAEQAMTEGATILDIGGYSSRPGAKDISVEEEWWRVNLGLKAIREVLPDVAISIDTFRSEVARRVLQEYGPVIINDISAGEIDEKMIEVVAEYDVPYVAMHMRGTPQTMQQNVDYEYDVDFHLVWICKPVLPDLASFVLGSETELLVIWNSTCYQNARSEEHTSEPQSR